MPILRYTGNAQTFRTQTAEDSPDDAPRMVATSRDARTVDVDEKTADKLLNLGVFEVADDSDDDGDPERPGSEEYDNFASLTGVGSATEDNLYDAGYETFDDLRSASDDDLLAIDGIGDSSLGELRDSLAERATENAGTDNATDDSAFDIGG